MQAAIHDVLKNNELVAATPMTLLQSRQARAGGPAPPAGLVCWRGLLAWSGRLGRSAGPGQVC